MQENEKGLYSVLMVDDDRDVLELNAQGFKLSGFKVTTAADGFEAIKELSIKKYDAIVTDFNMPSMDGIQLSAYIKVNSLNSKTPIFILSGDLDAKSIKRLQKMGILEIITKPYNIGDVVNYLENKLRGPRHIVDYHPKMVEVCNKNIANTLGFYFNSGVTIETPHLQSGKENFWNLCSTIALYGKTVYGSVSIFCGLGFMELLSAKLFQSESLDLGIDLYGDMLGELANQLAGDLKHLLLTEGFNVILGLPEITTSKKDSNMFKLANPRLSFPIRVNGAELTVEYLLGDPQKLKIDRENPDFSIFSYKKIS